MVRKIKNREVELRALLTDVDTINKFIRKMGGKYIGTSFLHDIYFCSKAIFSVEEAEMNEVGSYSLRLRKYCKNKIESVTLNTKTITKQGDHHAWEEHETKVSNFLETAHILLLTEFKPFFELKKTRYEYKFKGIGIFIEEIEDFGSAIELEILTVPGKEEVSKDKLLAFLVKLGLSKDDILPKSVTNIIMKQRAFKSEIAIAF